MNEEGLCHSFIHLFILLFNEYLLNSYDAWEEVVNEIETFLLHRAYILLERRERQ